MGKLQIQNGEYLVDGQKLEPEMRIWREDDHLGGFVGEPDGNGLMLIIPGYPPQVLKEGDTIEIVDEE